MDLFSFGSYVTTICDHLMGVYPGRGSLISMCTPSRIEEENSGISDLFTPVFGIIARMGLYTF